MRVHRDCCRSHAASHVCSICCSPRARAQTSLGSMDSWRRIPATPSLFVLARHHPCIRRRCQVAWLAQLRKCLLSSWLWSFCTATPPWVRVLGSLHTPEDGVTSSGAGGPTGMAGVECGGGCTCMPARFNRTVAEFSLPSLALLPVTSWSGDQNFKELKYDCMKTTHTRGHHTCPSPAAVPGPPAPRRRREEAPLTTCSPSSCRLGCLATSNTRRCLRTPCHPCSWHQRVASAFIA